MDDEESGEVNGDGVSSIRSLSSPAVAAIESELIGDVVDMDDGSDSEAGGHRVCDMNETENSPVVKQTFPVEALTWKLKRKLDRALKRQRRPADRQFYREIREKHGIHSNSASREHEVKPTPSVRSKRSSKEKRQKR
ncbi:hypothetical protein PHET_10848 [Paragonimus heterotremus]|uniref:Uncharacterized protein n=1 Tax=Paragonimus heterotremus TaxID=100268 RepID=A0A8J4T9L9_9TREM|nr:hypothetical protein PHET_10848 [Paragonimus heterotremus]